MTRRDRRPEALVLDEDILREGPVCEFGGELAVEACGGVAVTPWRDRFRAAEAAGTDPSFEVPREVRREEPSLTQPRPPPMAGFGANRPETGLGPEVEELMDEVFQKCKADLRRGFEESRRLRPESQVEGPDDQARARGRELFYLFHRMLDLHPEARDVLRLSDGSDSSSRDTPDGPTEWTQKSAKVFMMRAVLRATSTMDQDEQMHFMESNQVERVLKDALTIVIDECKQRSGSVYTGYLLRAVTSGTGAGPILQEGLETVFAKESLPLGEREEVRTEEGPEADPEERSEMEKAYLRAKESDFRSDPEYSAFREILAKRSDEARAWPVLDEEDVRFVEDAPRTGPAPEAAPMPVDEGPANGGAVAPSPELEEGEIKLPAEEKKSGSVSRLIAKFSRTAEAAQAPPHGPDPGGPGSAGRLRLSSSWLGKTLRRQEGARPEVQAQCRRLNEFRKEQVQEREAERIEADLAARDKKAEDYRKTQEQVAKSAVVSSRMGRGEVPAETEDRARSLDRAGGGSSSAAKRPRRTKEEGGVASSQPVERRAPTEDPNVVSLGTEPDEDGESGGGESPPSPPVAAPAPRPARPSASTATRRR